jgi:hypothetical protein
MHFGKAYPAILLAWCLFAVMPASAQPTNSTAPVCLDIRNITGTDSKDGKTIKFMFRDGSSRLNHLQSPCNGLIFGGFSWVIRNDDKVCENAQTLRVLNSGEICVLGKFDPVVKAAPTKN